MPDYNYNVNRINKRDSFIDRNANYFQSILGSLSDYSTKNKFSEYENDIKDYNERYKSFNQYKNVKKKLMDTELSRDELDYLQNQNSVDLTDPGILTSDAFKNHSAANPPKINPITGKADYSDPEYTSKFYESIKDNPEYAKYIKQTKITPTGDDLIKARMLKAGLTDDEKKLYDQYKNFDVNDYNKTLEENMLKHYPELVSQGPLGDQLAQVYNRKLKLNELVDLPPEKRKIEFNNGYMFKFDDYGNEISREKIKDDEKKFALSKDAVIKSYTDSNGNTAYSIFEPDPSSSDNGYTGWKNTGVSSNQRDYEYQEGTGEFAKETGSSGTGRRRNRGTSSKSGDDTYSDYDKDTAAKLKEFAKLKEQSVALGWDKFSEVVNDRGKIEKNKQSADALRYTELERELKNRVGEGVDFNDIANQLYKGEFNQKKGKKTKSEVEFVKDKVEVGKYKTKLSNFQNDIENNVYGYEKNGKKVANYNISAADWARELQEGGYLDDISDDEFEALAGWFKSKTGRDINSYLK